MRWSAIAAVAAAFAIASPSLANTAAPSRAPQAWSAPDRELMVSVEGGKVYVRINDGVAPPGTVPAVFIHGGPGGTHVNFAALLGLADERPVVLYDQLGSGKSERPDNPADWRVERYVDELEAIRTALGIEKWHLVGQSWGSAVALEYAVRFPNRVASTVLGGTFISTVHWITDANLLLAQMAPADRALVGECETPTPPPADACEAVFTKVYSPYYQPRLEPDLAEYRKRYGGKGFNPTVYKGMWGPSEFSSTGLLENYDATTKLLRLDGSKILFLIGQYDSARIDTVQEFVALTPGAELAVVPGGSHGFILDRPAETESILRAWLARKEPK